MLFKKCALSLNVVHTIWIHFSKREHTIYEVHPKSEIIGDKPDENLLKHTKL